MSRPAWRYVATIGFYVGLSLWVLRVILPAPRSTVAQPGDLPPTWRQVTASDQKLVISVVADHSQKLMRAPASFFDLGQCHPLRHALMMGHHEIGEGLLAVVPYALSADPVLSYNFVMVASIALAGLAMHALVQSWTGSLGAAVVAGTAFAIHPGRIGDLVHLSAVGNYWTPVSLLFLARFFVRPTWPATLLLGLTAGAQALEAIYQLIPHAIIFGIMSLWFAYRSLRDLRDLAPKLLVAALLAFAIVAAVLGPYVEFKAIWGSLAGRAAYLHPPEAFGFGGAAYTGSIVLVLAFLGIVGRRRQLATELRPQWPLLLAGLLVAWMSVAWVPIPGSSTPMPSLFNLIAMVVPGFDAFRRVGNVVLGWHLVVIVLAGYGVAFIARGRSTWMHAALAIALVPLLIGEVFVPRFAKATFGHTFDLVASAVRPPQPVLDLYERLGPGAVVDVPFELGRGRFYWMGDFVLAGAYHRHPVAACYNSFRTAIQDDVASYASRVLTDASAAEALAALDIRNVIYHLGLPSTLPLPSPLTTTAPHLEEVGRAANQIAYRINLHPAVTQDANDLEMRLRGAASQAIEVFFRNRAPTLYRHPEPIEPTAFVARWYGDAGASVRTDRITLLLPSALPAGEELRRLLPLANPAPIGARKLTVATAAHPDRELASLSFEK